MFQELKCRSPRVSKGLTSNLSVKPSLTVRLLHLRRCWNIYCDRTGMPDVPIVDSPYCLKIEEYRATMTDEAFQNMYSLLL